MLQILRVIGVSVGLVAASSVAFAGHNDQYTGSPGCGSGKFGGAYIGANVGFADARAEQSALGEPTVSSSESSVTFGAQAGYNIQCGAMVFGVETDFNFLDASTASAWADPILLNSKLDWFGTVRGRLGVVHGGDLLIYVTGGLAYANVSHSLVDPTIAFSQVDEGVQYGWTAGAGIELARDDRWSIRAEGLYVDLGSETHNYTSVGCGGVCTASAKWDDTFWVGRIGLNYRFGAREVEYAPLK